ncbi:hypothetical protein FSP39_007196 [Pinctada imbricata]|uniref:CARD domain-containing protein n=1 Tax=Pinctada imbricata TaxID=66713 RepID=A0AA88Y5G4_PINIB|nr:hypothetical protein FSP39_007196 [Pinctada imbricata]
MSDPLPVVEEDEYHRIIERNRHKIVKMINVNVFLDPLRTKGILSGDDAEEIQNSPIHITRKSKAGFFLDILQTKGDRGLEVFLEILEYELPQLFEEVTSKTAREPPQDYIKHRESVVMNWVYRLPEFAKDLQRDYDHNKDLRKKLKDMEEILKYAQDNNSFLEV